MEVWKQEAVESMHKESGRHELYSPAQATCLRVHRKIDSETEGSRQLRCFPKEWSFLSLVIAFRISPGVNAAGTRLEIER